MPTVASILAELKKKGTEQTRKTYARHGMAPERTFGVSTADMKAIAKTISNQERSQKGAQQALACELFETGKMEAMYIAGLVANGAQMSEKQLDQWADGAASLPMIAEYSVPWVAVENPRGRELALKWMKSKKELVASAGWSSYAGLLAITPDEQLDLAEIERLLEKIPEEIGSVPNRVRAKMNGFVIAVGSYVKPLLKQARAAAKRLGAVNVDVGDTDCKIPLATAYIEKMEASGRVGQKRKTIRC